MAEYFDSPLNDGKMAKIEHCVPHSQSNSLAAQTLVCTKEFSFALSTCEKLEEDK